MLLDGICPVELQTWARKKTVESFNSSHRDKSDQNHQINLLVFTTCELEVILHFFCFFNLTNHWLRPNVVSSNFNV